jgi:ankyrin repeat protein
MDTNTFLNAIRSSNKQEIRNIIKKGIDINESHHFCVDGGMEETALHYVCRLNINQEIAEILINEGNADINNMDLYGLTPLMVTNNFDIFKFLVLRGANLGIRDKVDHVNILNLYSNDGELERVDFLLKNSNAMYYEDVNYTSSFLLACTEGNLEIAKLLIKYGTNINAVNNQGSNALIVILLENDYYYYDNSVVSFMKFLITEGVDPYMKNNLGKTYIDYLSDTAYVNIKNEMIKFQESFNFTVKPAKNSK